MRPTYQPSASSNNCNQYRHRNVTSRNSPFTPLLLTIQLSACQAESGCWIPRHLDLKARLIEQLPDDTWYPDQTVGAHFGVSLINRGFVEKPGRLMAIQTRQYSIIAGTQRAGLIQVGANFDSKLLVVRGSNGLRGFSCVLVALRAPSRKWVKMT